MPCRQLLPLAALLLLLLLLGGASGRTLSSSASTEQPTGPVLDTQQSMPQAFPGEGSYFVRALEKQGPDSYLTPAGRARVALGERDLMVVQPSPSGQAWEIMFAQLGLLPVMGRMLADLGDGSAANGPVLAEAGDEPAFYWRVQPEGKGYTVQAAEGEAQGQAAAAAPAFVVWTQVEGAPATVEWRRAEQTPERALWAFEKQR